MSVNSKLTAIADEIRELSGATESMGLDAMAGNLGEANDEVASQEDLIADIVAALEGKAAGGSEAKLPTLTNPATEDEIFLNKEVISADGNKLIGAFTLENELTAQDNLIAQIQSVVDNLPDADSNLLTLQNKTVTPTATSQVIVADSEYDGLSSVTVNGDINLVPDNIVSGKTIFGITGTATNGNSANAEGVCPQLTIIGTENISLSECFYQQNGVYVSTNTGGLLGQSCVLNNVDVDSTILICVIDNGGLLGGITGINSTELIYDTSSSIILAKCTVAGENSTIQLKEFSFWG